jgi:DNA-binding transcriptional LysR family regulator
MNIHHLAVLAAIAEEGSFSAAALRLDTSQAATSRAIAALEDELGLPLLKRGRFGAMLTPVGQRVLHHAQQMLELREYIEYEVNLEKGLYAGRLRIASFRSAATHLLPPIMASFHERFPRVEVSLTELEPPGVEQALREGQVDLGLVPLPRSEEFNQSLSRPETLRERLRCSFGAATRTGQASTHHPHSQAQGFDAGR